MAKKLYDVVAVLGEYTDRATGEKKPQFQRCGAVFETAKGLRMKLDVIPVGGDGWFGLYEPRPKQEAPAKPKPQAPATDFEDDIPF